jgi:hypothetical protein
VCLYPAEKISVAVVAPAGGTRDWSRVQNLRVKSVMNVAHRFYIEYHQIFSEGFGNLSSIFVRHWKIKTEVLQSYSKRAHEQRCRSSPTQCQ